MTKLRAMLAALAALCLIGTDVRAQQATQLPPGKSCFTGSVGQSGVIGSLSSPTPGSGGADGTYSIALLAGSGSGATATIVVSGGVVASQTLVNPGQGYVVGDVLTASPSAIGGVLGYSTSVTATAISGALAGGSAAFYVPSTTTPKSTWQDAGEVTLNPNPVSLDGNGCALIYGVGSYRQVLKDNLGNTVWDQSVTAPTPAPTFGAGVATALNNAVNTTGGVVTVTANGPPISALNNAALNALPITAVTTGQSVFREGFAAAGDGGEAWFNPSSSACSLNSGAGDGGSQVPAFGGGCWLVVYTNGVVSLALFGPDPTHARASDTAVSAWWKACMGTPIAGNPAIGGNKCFVPRGNYQLQSRQEWDFAFNIGGGAEVFGVGANASNFDFVNDGGDILVHNTVNLGFFYPNFHDFGVTCKNTTVDDHGCFQAGANPEDALNGALLRELRIANSSFAAGSAGLVLDGFYNGRVETVTTSDGCTAVTAFGTCASSSGGDSLKILQASFSYINGSFSGATCGIHLTGAQVGQSQSLNTFDALDLEVNHSGFCIDTTFPQGAYNNQINVSQYVWCAAVSGCHPTGVASTNSLVGGSGYVDGVYQNIALTGGSGTGITGYATVKGGVVVQFTIFDTGTGATVGDTLTTLAANLGGGGSGFSVRVAGLVTSQGYAVIAPNANAQTYNNVFNVPSFDSVPGGTDGTCTGATAALGVIVKSGTLGVSTPPFVSSPQTFQNTTARPILVTVYGGTVSDVCYGTTGSICLGPNTPASFILNPCDEEIVTYSTTPGHVWQPLP